MGASPGRRPRHGPNRLVSLPLFVASFAIFNSVCGDCPPRKHEAWEGSSRASILAAYDKYNMRCPEVNVALSPERLQVDTDMGHSSLQTTVYWMWTDPALVTESGSTEIIRVNSSEIWVPKLIGATSGDRALTPSPLTSEYIEVRLATGFVVAFFSTTLAGSCSAHETRAWPRDRLVCSFFVQPAPGENFNISHRINVQELDEFRSESHAMQRPSAWRVLRLESELVEGEFVSVQAELQRLPAHLEAVAVQPAVVVGALVPASAVLSPASAERPAILAACVVLHAVNLLGQHSLAIDMVGDDPPRNLLLHRDFGLLLLLLVLQWLFSASLASRKRPLSTCMRAVARALVPLRRFLLLPEALSSASSPEGRAPRDEQSVALAEVMDRIAFVAAATGYLVLVSFALN